MAVAGERTGRPEEGREDYDASALPVQGGIRSGLEERKELETAMRRLLLALGVLLITTALFWPLLSRYVGRLPGDIVVRRPGFTLAFPIVTCILLSILLTLLLSLLRR